MAMYEIRHAYDSLQVAEEKSGELSLEARLRAINRPLLDWYRNHAGFFPGEKIQSPTMCGFQRLCCSRHGLRQ